MTIKTINKKDRLYTDIEISGQPELWGSVYQLLLSDKEKISEFLKPSFQLKNLQIILTGAGSSAFVGESAQGFVQKNTGCNTKAIATTDLVTHPDLYFQPGLPTLLISFARSGNSPESLETVKLADVFCKEIYHLIITCNKEGELLNYAAENVNRTYALLLPEASNDKSLAMTGSFTSMLLSILLISDIRKLRNREIEVSRIFDQGISLLENGMAVKEIAAKGFERVVFLGSGPMLGIARECHLKLQELTDGKVVGKHDSFLGFRHGPRAVINKKTLLVYLFSPNDFVYKYELDLALSIGRDNRKIECLSIGRSNNNELGACLNIDLKLTPEDELNIIPAVLVGQLLGYYTSLNNGLNPDNPSVSGAINRVVKGVNIYDYPKNHA